MDKRLLITGSIFGFLAVILGAFAAHGLKELIDSDALTSFQTGVRYQMYHALLLLFLGTSTKINQKGKSILFYTLLFGIVFFSGSIYGLSTQGITNLNFKTIAFVTPLGGLLLGISWFIMLINFIKLKAD